MTKYKNEPSIEQWVTRELWFMRGAAATLIVTAILSMFQGLLYNPSNSPVIDVFNFLIVIVMLALGGMALFWSLSRQRIYRMVDDLSLQAPSRSMSVAVIQGIFGILFLFEGIGRGRLSVWLLAAMMIVSAFWYVQRANNIKVYQERLEEFELYTEPPSRMPEM